MKILRPAKYAIPFGYKRTAPSSEVHNFPTLSPPIYHLRVLIEVDEVAKTFLSHIGNVRNSDWPSEIALVGTKLNPSSRRLYTWSMIEQRRHARHVPPQPRMGTNTWSMTIRDEKLIMLTWRLRPCGHKKYNVDSCLLRFAIIRNCRE